jgi:response regulator RpfG family c-di-GMP phosphodiesterase
MKNKNNKNDERKAKSEFILSVKDVIHLQEEPNIDTSQFIIKPQSKAKVPLVTTAIISDAERQQYFSTDKEDDKNAELARKAQEVVKKIETDIAHKRDEAAKTVAEHMKAVQEIIEENASTDGDITSGFDFGALITDAVLKDV